MPSQRSATAGSSGQVPGSGHRPRTARSSIFRQRRPGRNGSTSWRHRRSGSSDPARRSSVIPTGARSTCASPEGGSRLSTTGTASTSRPRRGSSAPPPPRSPPTPSSTSGRRRRRTKLGRLSTTTRPREVGRSHASSARKSRRRRSMSSPIRPDAPMHWVDAGLRGGAGAVRRGVPRALSPGARPPTCPQGHPRCPYRNAIEDLFTQV